MKFIILLLLFASSISLTESGMANPAAVQPLELPPATTPVTVPELPSNDVPAAESKPNPPAKNYQPVWIDLRTDDLSIPTSPRKKEQFNRKAGGENKVQIKASHTRVMRGEPITFTLESPYRDVRYFWLIEKQKGATQEFTVDTSPLPPGKHRVRVTITDKNRKQYHSAAFFTVVKREFDGTEEQQQAPDSATDAQQQQTVAPESREYQISPTSQRVSMGNVAEFTLQGAIDENQNIEWRFNGNTSKGQQLTIETQSLSAGNYPIEVQIAQATGTPVIATAELVILPKETQLHAVPDMTGQHIDEIDELMAQNQLQKGQISTRKADDPAGTILQHSPAAGEEVEKDAEVNFVVALDDAAAVPNILGMTEEGARQAIINAGLVVGQFQKKATTDQIGRIIEQQPVAGTELNRGASVDMVVGVPREIAPPGFTDLVIKPGKAVIEQGKTVDFGIETDDLLEGIQYEWTVGDIISKEALFKLDTDALNTGQHTVTLKLIQNGKAIAERSATVVVQERVVLMPYLTDLGIDEAQAKLAELGLEIGEIERQEAAVKSPKVIKQSPDFGEKIKQGSKITLTVVVPRNTSGVSLELSSEVSEARAGEAIKLTSTLSPADAVTGDLHFVYNINDQKKANIRPEYEWVPDAEGIYTISVGAYDQSGLVAESTPISIRVNTAWELPVAAVTPELVSVFRGERVDFVSTSTYDVNSDLKYAWNSSSGHSGSKKHFSFETADLDPGSYEIILSVTDSQGNISEAKSTLSLTAQLPQTSLSATTANPPDAGNTTDAGDGKKAGNTEISRTVSMIASRRFAKIGDEIRFRVSSNADLSHAEFAFNTRDGGETQWLKDPLHTHHFSSFGSYRVQAAIREGETTTLTRPLTIWVWSHKLLAMIATLGIVLFGLIFWWTNRNNDGSQPVLHAERSEPVIAGSDQNRNKLLNQAVTTEQEQPQPQAAVAEQPEIITEKRRKANASISHVLLKALIQFLTGLALAAVILYFILQAMGI